MYWILKCALVQIAVYCSLDFIKHIIKSRKKDVPAATDTPLKVRFGLKTRNGYIPLSESCCELSHNGIKSSTVSVNKLDGIKRKVD